MGPGADYFLLEYCGSKSQVGSRSGKVGRYLLVLSDSTAAHYNIISGRIVHQCM